MKPALAVVLLVLPLLAGCAAPSGGSGALQAGAITPDLWHLNGATDHLLVWVHNVGKESADYAWSLTGAGGAPLPEGLAVSFAAPSGTLAAAGSKTGRTFNDWAYTVVTATLNASLAPGPYPLELHAGSAVAALAATVEAERVRVSKPGDNVNVHYAGSFQATGEEFDSGEFPTKLGSGQTVPGFDLGLLGLAVGEKAHLVLPAPLGYGNGNTGSYARFNDQTLIFDVELLQFR